MSDTAPVVEPPAAPAPIIAPPDSQTPPPDSQTPPVESQTPAPPTSDGPIVDPFDLGQTDFKRPYVEALRNEAAARRVALREAEAQLNRYQDSFSQLSPDDQDALLGFARLLAQDPEQAATWMVDAGQQMRDQFAQAQQALNPEAQADADRPLTRAEVEQMMQAQIAQQQQAAQRDSMIQHWNREANRLGYDPFAKPDAPEGPMRWLQFQQLVKMAELTSGNLEQAHQMLVAQAHGAAAQQVAQRAAAVRSQATGQTPAAPVNEGQRQESDSEMWARVNAAVRERMNGDSVT